MRKHSSEFWNLKKELNFCYKLNTVMLWVLIVPLLRSVLAWQSPKQIWECSVLNITVLLKFIWRNGSKRLEALAHMLVKLFISAKEGDGCRPVRPSEHSHRQLVRIRVCLTSGLSVFSSSTYFLTTICCSNQTYTLKLIRNPTDPNPHQSNLLLFLGESGKLLWEARKPQGPRQGLLLAMSNM